ncbi:hypothetical protein JD969_05080 [Planctomycetota bacterium]|nr:hypothetical protein JD969_05080 [Planctomycetota bacterium]
MCEKIEEACEQVVEMDDPRRIQEDLHCLNCNYNLRTLLRYEKCSECGMLIEETIANPSFRFTSKDHTRTAKIAVVSFIVSFLLHFIEGNVAQVSPWMSVMYVSLIIKLMSLGALLVGMFCLLEKPYEFSRRNWLGVWGVVIAAVYFIGVCLFDLLFMMPWGIRDTIGIAVVTAVTFLPAAIVCILAIRIGGLLKALSKSKLVILMYLFAGMAAAYLICKLNLMLAVFFTAVFGWLSGDGNTLEHVVHVLNESDNYYGDIVGFLGLEEFWSRMVLLLGIGVPIFGYAYHALRQVDKRCDSWKQETKFNVVDEHVWCTRVMRIGFILMLLGLIAMAVQLSGLTMKNGFMVIKWELGFKLMFSTYVVVPGMFFCCVWMMTKHRVLDVKPSKWVRGWLVSAVVLMSWFELVGGFVDEGYLRMRHFGIHVMMLTMTGAVGLICCYVFSDYLKEIMIRVDEDVSLGMFNFCRKMQLWTGLAMIGFVMFLVFAGGLWRFDLKGLFALQVGVMLMTYLVMVWSMRGVLKKYREVLGSRKGRLAGRVM